MFKKKKIVQGNNNIINNYINYNNKFYNYGYNYTHQVSKLGA